MGHNLKAIYRNMLKNKLYTFFNVAGMAVAFACSILLFLSVYQDFSFDKFHVNGDKIYKVYSFSNAANGPELSEVMAYPAGPALKADNIGITKFTRVRYGGGKIRYKAKELELTTVLVDPDFLRMFSFRILQGNRVNPLADLGKVVLSANDAASLFGSEDPVGKTVETEISGTWKSLEVSAVIENPPVNSSIQFGALARTETHGHYPAIKDEWNNQHHPVYVQLAENTTQESTENRLRSFVKTHMPPNIGLMKARGYRADAKGDFSGLKLLPLADVHFNPEIGTGDRVNRSFLYILVLTGVVVLVIACFNFINLSIGLSFTRTREMGVRKCLGAGKANIWTLVWGEGFVTTLVAMVIGVAAAVLLIPSFNQLFVAKLETSLLYDPVIGLLLPGILLFVSLFAGSYPALAMTKLKVVEVLKGKIALKTNGLFRNTLVAFQFIIACVLISTTMVIYRQFRHLRSAPLGYTTTSMISIPVYDQSKGKELIRTMRLQLASQPAIVSVSGSSFNLGIGKDRNTGKWSSNFGYKGKVVRTNWMEADYDFLKTLTIKQVEGRDFSSAYASDSVNAVIVTESMAKQLTDGHAVGMEFFADSAQAKLHIVGVIPDFHLYSMFEDKEPISIMLKHEESMAYILVKVNTTNPAATMELVKKTYAKLEPGKEFKGSFVTENIERWYAKEKRLSRLFSIAAGVAIVLSCMGLFGISLIVVRQRLKEIGVRKVLGASVSRIAAMISKDFLKPVLLAIVISVPLSWLILNKWLQDFSYRITIGWWMFVYMGMAALLIALATVSFQAIKAALANPVKSLKTE
ncbi:ABC transporter permease [Hufsiella ginkgonis]|uniref:FtsX-like permease family protein n=1 Tax=Hufsiella ginkgonis TaxID=2695274 RepID=A0A7K1XV20_9SPHI|nr:ABC transporter permease [Hufsiella ginkgonis]MXV14853.1 FtsX-like permease family protein [Hufsiella ginkgonis]